MSTLLLLNEQQTGPYTAAQLREMWKAGTITSETLYWREGMTEWQPLSGILHELESKPAPPAVSPPPSIVQTNVRQGAIIGGWVCFGLGLLCLWWSLFLFFFYGTFFLVAFILSIVAMSQRRVLGGVSLLITTLLVPSILALVLFTTRTSKLAEEIVKSVEESSKAEVNAESAGAATLADGDKKATRSSSVTQSITDTMKKGLEDAQREKDLKALKELRSRKVEFEKKLDALKGFRVLQANFSNAENSIGIREPTIELTVQNDTAHPVKRAYFRGVLASPGRSIPWIDETFNYSVAGGVEPGEKVAWTLSPGMFGKWGNVDAPTDARFTVTVYRLDGPDGQPLFGNADFKKSDAERMEKLEKKYHDEQVSTVSPVPSPASPEASSAPTQTASTVPAAPETVTVPSPQQDLVILKATYAGVSVQRDVAAILQGKVRNRQLQLNVANDQFGGDPEFGKVKTLTVVYRDANGDHSISVQEGGKLTIPNANAISLSPKTVTPEPGN